MTIRKSLFAAAVAVLVISLYAPSNAQRSPDDRRYHGRWMFLGQSRVDGNRDHDLVPVNANGGFRAIQLRVSGGPIEFNRVVVHFENGNDHEVEVRDRIRSGGQTRPIDLPGDRRRIRGVEVWYGQGNWGRRRPTLRVYGMR